MTQEDVIHQRTIGGDVFDVCQVTPENIRTIAYWMDLEVINNWYIPYNGRNGPTTIDIGDWVLHRDDQFIVIIDSYYRQIPEE